MKKLFVILGVLIIVVASVFLYRFYFVTAMKPGYQTIAGNREINVPSNYVGRKTGKGFYLNRTNDTSNFIDTIAVIGPTDPPVSFDEKLMKTSRQASVNQSKLADYYKDSTTETLNNGDYLFILEETKKEGTSHSLTGDITSKDFKQIYFFSAQVDGQDDWPIRKEEFLRLLRSIRSL